MKEKHMINWIKTRDSSGLNRLVIHDYIAPMLRKISLKAISAVEIFHSINLNRLTGFLGWNINVIVEKELFIIVNGEYHENYDDDTFLSLLLLCQNIITLFDHQILIDIKIGFNPTNRGNKQWVKQSYNSYLPIDS